MWEHHQEKKISFGDISELWNSVYKRWWESVLESFETVLCLKEVWKYWMYQKECSFTGHNRLLRQQSSSLLLPWLLWQCKRPEEYFSPSSCKFATIYQWMLVNTNCMSIVQRQIKWFLSLSTVLYQGLPGRRLATEDLTTSGWCLISQNYLSRLTEVITQGNVNRHSEENSQDFCI